MNVKIITKDTLFFERLAESFARKGYNDVTLIISDRRTGASFSDVLLIEDKSESGLVPDPDEMRADAFFTDYPGSDAGEVPTIAKYSGVSSLHAGILLAAERKKRAAFRPAGGSCRIALFCGAEGGAGASVLASAAALAQAPASFYLNLEKCNGDVYFRAEEGGTLADVLFAIKSRNNSGPEKISSLFSKDGSGVGFILPDTTGTDREGIDAEACGALCRTLRTVPGLRFAAIDAPFEFSPAFRALTDAADAVFLVRDGRCGSDKKADDIKAFLKAGGKETHEIFNRSGDTGNGSLCVPDFGTQAFADAVEMAADFLKKLNVTTEAAGA